MKICLSIAPSTTNDAVKKLYKFRNVSDVIELRIDGIKKPNLEKIFSIQHPKLIITNRTVKEGGKFRGTDNDNSKLLSQATHLGADYIDVEFSRGKNFIRQLIRQNKKTKLICSYHNFKNTPPNIHSIYESMKKIGAPIIKIVTKANDIVDNKIIFDLLEKSRKDKQKLISFCMNECGEIGRILGARYGNILTYATVRGKIQTAPGQFTIDEMKNIFRVESINKQTKFFGLIGNPVKYSKGIYLHNKIFHSNKLNAVYVNLLVDDLQNFIYNFRDDFTGYSVTMPFKEKINRHLDQVDKSIRELNVVNTVVKKGNKLIGYNTDLMAIDTILKSKINFYNREAVIIGTGSMARTFGYYFKVNGVKTIIAGRSADKAKKLSNEIGCEWISLHDVELLAPDILINATSVGMSTGNSSKLISKKVFKKNMIVFDVVPTPSQTRFIKDAANTGCKVIEGNQLFEHQAKYQSELFMSVIK